MKKTKILLSLLLALCVMVCLAPLHGEAYADSTEYYGKWYQVEFTPVRDRETGRTTSFSYYYNESAATLIIRGTGEMPAFSAKYPAPWASLNLKATRVIFERNITSISAYAFEKFTKLRSLVLPATLKEIDPEAFIGCENLHKVEYAGELSELAPIFAKADIPELTDAKQVRVTERAIQDEITRLTWYRVCNRLKVRYDRAGRPVRIVEVTPDGTVFDTEIKYVNDFDSNIHADRTPTSRDTVELRNTVSTLPDGSEIFYERDKNDLGQTVYFSSADKDGKGGAYYSGDYGVYKSGTMSASYSSDGSGVRVWENTDVRGHGTETVVETVNAKHQVLSVTTVGYDAAGSVSYTSETKNNYNETTGRLESTTVSESSPDGSHSAEGRTTYSYNADGTLQAYSTKAVSDGVTATEEGSFTYNAKGLKTGKTVVTKAGGGTVTTNTAYNDKERATTETVVVKNSDGTSSKSVTQFTYNDNNLVTTAQTTTTNSDGSSEVTSKTYNGMGYVATETTVTTAADGSKSTRKTDFTYDASGKLVSQNSTGTAANGDKDVKTVTYNAKGQAMTSDSSYEPEGAAVLRTSSVYSYDEDGGVAEKVKTLTEDGSVLDTARIEASVTATADPDAIEAALLEQEAGDSAEAKTEDAVPSEEADAVADTDAEAPSEEAEGPETVEDAAGAEAAEDTEEAVNVPEAAADSKAAGKEAVVIVEGSEAPSENRTEEDAADTGAAGEAEIVALSGDTAPAPEAGETAEPEGEAIAPPSTEVEPDEKPAGEEPENIEETPTPAAQPEPDIEEPKTEEPKSAPVEEPKAEEPEPAPAEEPKAEEPKSVPVEEPKVEEPEPAPVEEPKTEEPKAEEPKPAPAEEPKVEEPKPAPAEEPKAEEPELTPAEEPKAEEPEPAPVEEPKAEEPEPAPAEEPRAEEPEPVKEETPAPAAQDAAAAPAAKTEVPAARPDAKAASEEEQARKKKKKKKTKADGTELSEAEEEAAESRTDEPLP